jgi:hypothetical protein
MTSDIPGDPVPEPLEDPDEEAPPDTDPEPGATSPRSAAEEQFILDEGQSQTSDDSA